MVKYISDIIKKSLVFGNETTIITKDKIYTCDGGGLYVMNGTFDCGKCLFATTNMRNIKISDDYAWVNMPNSQLHFLISAKEMHPHVVKLADANTYNGSKIKTLYAYRMTLIDDYSNGTMIACDTNATYVMPYTEDVYIISRIKMLCRNLHKVEDEMGVD